MPKLLTKPNTRLLCVRVAEAEYDAFAARALAAGNSSLSPWIREVLRGQVKTRGGRPAAALTLAQLELRIAALEKGAN